MSTSPNSLAPEKSHSTGPRTEAGKAASSQNAITYGLFATRDFIRPGEREIYDNFAQSLQTELAPIGMLELNLADEIRRAMWRLRRCAQIEENFSGPTDDPMQHEATARLQVAVDRARSQAHRLLHKCTAELRKLQTERQHRNASFDEGTDVTALGVCDLSAVQKNIAAQHVREFRHQKLAEEAAVDAMLNAPYPPQLRTTPESPGSFCKTAPATVSQAQNLITDQNDPCCLLQSNCN